MVLEEIRKAHDLFKEQGRPVILPVRLAYQEEFVYPLSAYLNPLNWALWEGPEDTPKLVDELVRAIGGGALSIDVQAQTSVLQAKAPEAIPMPLAAAQPPPRLELPEGTMDAYSAFYIERPGADEVALDAIKREGGVTITIKGPRQMGKSSLLRRTVARAVEAGKQVIFLDF